MWDSLKSYVDILAVFGIPSIFAMTSWCIRECKKYTKQLKILMKSQQAQMRSQLLKDYITYKTQGYITDLQLQDWENQYQSYHALDANGVMDSKRAEILNLPLKGA